MNFSQLLALAEGYGGFISPEGKFYAVGHPDGHASLGYDLLNLDPNSPRYPPDILKSKGWVVVSSDENVLDVKSLDSRTKDAIWDWASGLPPENWLSIFVGSDSFNRVPYKTTAGRITKDFDFGDGVHESLTEVAEGGIKVWSQPASGRLHMIELAAVAPSRATTFTIEWWGVGHKYITTTAGEILKDSSVLESLSEHAGLSAAINPKEMSPRPVGRERGERDWVKLNRELVKLGAKPDPHHLDPARWGAFTNKAKAQRPGQSLRKESRAMTPFERILAHALGKGNGA